MVLLIRHLLVNDLFFIVWLCSLYFVSFRFTFLWISLVTITRFSKWLFKGGRLCFVQCFSDSATCSVRVVAWRPFFFFRRFRVFTGRFIRFKFYLWFLTILDNRTFFHCRRVSFWNFIWYYFWLVDQNYCLWKISRSLLGIGIITVNANNFWSGLNLSEPSLFQIQAVEQLVNLFKSSRLNLRPDFVIFTEEVQSEILIVFVTYLTVVVVLMRTRLWNFFVAFGILVYIVLFVFGEIFIVFSFSLLFNFGKFFCHELFLALINDWAETIWCGVEFKTKNVKLRLERLFSHFSRKPLWSTSGEFLSDCNLVSATFCRTHTSWTDCRTWLYWLKLMEDLFVGHVKLVVMFV